jgi:hypothetical protein
MENRRYVRNADLTIAFDELTLCSGRIGSEFQTYTNEGRF